MCLPIIEVGVWGVVDANGNPLYGGNDRDAVEADLEGRVATDDQREAIAGVETYASLTAHPLSARRRPAGLAPR